MKIVKLFFNRHLKWNRCTTEHYARGTIQFRTFGPFGIRMEKPSC